MIVTTRPGRTYFPLFLAALLTVAAVLAFVSPTKAQAQENVFTVYLQAGHSPSALGNGNIQSGVKESVINEKLTQATYHAMKANGLHVVLLNPITIDPSLPSLIKAPPGEKGQYSYYSPEPAMLTALTYPSRFDPSVTRQGDLVVCLHHNAYSNSAVNGYEIYYANTVGGDYGRTQDAAVKSRQAADLMDKALATGKFGIAPRTPVVRENSSHNGITKNSPIPAVLIEAGYMSNRSDFAAMQKSANQSVIAAKLAEAVVNYRNTVWDGGPAAEPTPAAPAPTTAPTGQPPADIGAASFGITAVSGTVPAFTVRAAFDTAVTSAKIVVWPVSEGEANAKTYPLSADGSIYTANISTADFGGKTGNYAFQLYASDTQGHTKYVAVGYGKTDAAASASPGAPAEQAWPAASGITVAKTSDTATAATLKALDVTDKDGVAGVRFAVWSVAGGQDDLRWYTAKKSGNTWTAEIRNTDHQGNVGSFITHAYATDTKKNDGIIGSAVFTLGAVPASGDTEAPKMTGSLTYNLHTSTALSLGVSGVSDASGVRNVRFAFWAKSDQSDLAWYEGQRIGSSWSCEVDLTNHPSEYGSYNCHVYAMDMVGNDGLLEGKTLKLGTDTLPPKADRVAATVISSGTNLAILTAENVTDTDSGIENVRFAVWTNKNGQDDLIWYNAEPSKGTSDWDVTITAQKHNDEKGPYTVHAYATDKAGNAALVGYTVLTFDSGDKTPPRASGLAADAEVYTKQHAVFTAKDVTDDTGVAGVQIAVWKADEPSTRKTYTAKRSGLQWSITFDWSDEFTAAGMYRAEAVATDYAGNQAVVAGCEVEVKEAALGGYPIMGTSGATLAQLVNFLSRYTWSDEWYDLTLPEFCALYYDICAAEGVRAEVAVSQMVHETGGLRYGNLVLREQYNFAGIGATGVVKAETDQNPNYRYTEDGVEAGINFISVESGIKSHVQHLKAYASKDALVLPRSPEYDRYELVSKGVAPTVEDLTGKWAVDTSYSVKIMQYIETILGESTQMPDGVILTPAPGGDEEMA